MRYFARVTAGLEQIAWQEIVQHRGAMLSGFGSRRIDFTYDGDPASLLTLRSVDDLYVHVTQFSGIGHTRQSLADLTQKFLSIDFTAALAVCAKVRKLPTPPRYSITASYLGKRNYSRYDVETAIEAAITQRLPWIFVPNRIEEHSDHDIDLRILLENDWVLVGLRLGAMPLHRRSYKVESRPGSLKAPVAYCLCQLAHLKPDDTILDPMCGVGTILLEAQAFVTHGRIIGGDRERSAIEATQKNIEASGTQSLTINHTSHIQTIMATHKKTEGMVFLYQGNASTLPLPEKSIQAVITNIPWGQQVSADTDLTLLYTQILREIERVLVPSGRTVVLTDQHDLFREALMKLDHLSLASSWQISLFGRHPAISIIKKL